MAERAFYECAILRLSDCGGRQLPYAIPDGSTRPGAVPFVSGTGSMSSEALKLSMRAAFHSTQTLLGLLLFSALALPASSTEPKGAPASAAQARYVITDYGAMGDGQTLNTKPIQAAIDRCAAQGGGVLVIPKGTFIIGSIFLKQGVNLRVESDGVLKGSTDTNDYPWIDTRIAGLEMKWPAALINADGVTGLELTGQGTIDGSGLRWWEEYWRTRAAEKGGIDPHFKVARPRLVHIIRSQKITVSDLLLKDAAFWHLQLTYCDGVEIHGLKVRAPHEPVHAASSDGIDIDSTRNVLITNCDIVCDDDGICLKSGRDADGLRVNRPTENVEIRDCHVGYAHGMVVMGSETSGGIRHVRVSHCRADGGCFYVARFKTHMDRGGVVEDILFDDIQADNVVTAIGFEMDALGKTWLPEAFRIPVPPEKGTPVMRNITIRNLKATGCKSAGRIVGLPASPLQNITLENVQIQAGRGFTFKDARDLHFTNVTFNDNPVAPPKQD